MNLQSLSQPGGFLSGTAITDAASRAVQRLNGVNVPAVNQNAASYLTGQMQGQ